MNRILAAATVAVLAMASPAAGATLQERDRHINKYLTQELTPSEDTDPWAKPKQVRISDGFAHRPSLLKAAWVKAVVEVGYVKAPKPSPVVESSSTVATVTAPSSGVGAQVGVYAIPTYIVMCESGGNYLAENAYSTASGAYQIIDGTWAGYGGYSHASHAPPAVQDAKAAELWAGGAGASHWAACL